MIRAIATMMALVSFLGCTRADEPHPILLQLADLPTGIEITHTPVEVAGPAEGLGTGWPYSWQFKTEIRSLGKRLTVETFGIAAWDGDQWVIPTSQAKWNCGVLDRDTFAEWYGVSGGVLKPGSTAVDPRNWAGSKHREDFQQKWFVIAIDEENKRWKGEGIVHLKVQD